MKKYFLIPLALLFFACAGEESSTDETNDESVEETADSTEAVEEIVVGDNFTELTSYKPENSDGNLAN